MGAHGQCVAQFRRATEGFLLPSGTGLGERIWTWIANLSDELLMQAQNIPERVT